MAGPYDIGAARQKFFQNKRDDIDRNANTQTQEAHDALTRRFTSMGQAGSGASIAAGLKANQDIQTQANQQRNELAGQEIQVNTAIEEAQKARDFQAGESGLQRGFQEKMALGDQGFKRGLFDIEQGNKLKELDLAERQFALDKDTTEFNKRLAEIEANREAPGMFDSILGKGSTDWISGKKGLLGNKGGFMGSGVGGDVGRIVSSPLGAAAPLIGGGGK